MNWYVETPLLGEVSLLPPLSFNLQESRTLALNKLYLWVNPSIRVLKSMGKSKTGTFNVVYLFHLYICFIEF